ncbi:LexA family protein [Tepidicella xavieri]|jgi:DNA-binding MarR family transcriptional regulator|uniref:Repressor LexA n=1 Tax=Tepidicella xavieri TaxID=360241 RepID=A0A4R6UFJ0_9BURK|nr:MarR family transcriptional regulator [Tepidicella xavieri]TDQ41894.1 repressor LexA [Tepidicella xavieri]
MSKRKTEGITEPQTRTLRAICQIFDSTGLPPTVKELAEVLGISHASAHEQIAQLVRKGYLRKEEKKARSIVIVKRHE